MRKSEIIALTATISFVFGLIIAISVVLYLDSGKQKQIAEIEHTKHIQDINNKVIKEFAQKQKLRLDQNHFADNINTFLDVNVFYRDEGFLRYKIHLKIENKSKYRIEYLIVNVDYLKNNAVVKNEDIEIKMLRPHQIQEIKIPYIRSCDSWKWRFTKIKCKELVLNYTEQ
ncbi:MAG: hypothetical protein RIS29_2511 [Bacteroidota bacterium]|jgi:hypothetical protein